ncbi:hypothetical protein D3C74_246010 [compost metagenome]
MISLIVLSSVLASNHLPLTKSELLTDDNRHLIGKETISNYYVIYQNGKYIDSNGKEISKDELLSKSQDQIPENRIIQHINLKNFAPSSIVEFKTDSQDGMFISPEIITINNSVSTLTKSDGKGWELEKGNKIRFDLTKYPSEVIENQKLMIGYVKDGVLNEGQVFEQLDGEYAVEVADPGVYYLYLINVSSDPISLKNGTLIIQ